MTTKPSTVVTPATPVSTVPATVPARSPGTEYHLFLTLFPFALLLILKMVQQGIRQLNRKGKILTAPARLQQFEQRVEQERMVVEIGSEACIAVLVTGQQAAVPYEIAPQELDGIGCRVSGFFDGGRAGRVFLAATVEIEGHDRPALVCRWLSRGYLED